MKEKITRFRQLIDAYIDGNYGKKRVVGHYRIIDDGKKLIYRGFGRNVGFGDDVLLIKLKDGRVVGNASMLQRCGSYLSQDEAPAQQVMFEKNIAMVPFNVFEECNLDIQKATVIEQGAEEELLLPRLEWKSLQKSMQPVEIYFEDKCRKEPFSDSKRDILEKELKKDQEYQRDKNGIIKYSKKGNELTKTVEYWYYKYLDKTRLAGRHFVGAMVLRVRRKYFLFDVDRNEIEHYRFNPFLAELPCKVSSIEEAYEVLKPKEVKEAEKKGLKVKRQGEWFFIPTRRTGKPKIPALPKKIAEAYVKRPSTEEYDINTSIIGYCDGIRVNFKDVKSDLDYKRIKPKYRKAFLQRAKDYDETVAKWIKVKEKKEKFEETNVHHKYGGELKAGENRPNRAGELYRLDGVTFVKGIISHTGREHEPINLTTWHKAIPNTAIKSFTITGNID